MCIRDSITSGANKDVEQDHRAYYRRMRYPDSYKCNTLYINKFEKNIKRTMRYQFINAFPKTMTSIPVSYGDADLLRVSVTFNYDRYIVNPRGSYIDSPVSDFDDIPRTFLDTRFSRYPSQSLFNSVDDPLPDGALGTFTDQAGTTIYNPTIT